MTTYTNNQYQKDVDEVDVGFETLVRDVQNHSLEDETVRPLIEDAAPAMDDFTRLHNVHEAPRKQYTKNDMVKAVMCNPRSLGLCVAVLIAAISLNSLEMALGTLDTLTSGMAASIFMVSECSTKRVVMDSTDSHVLVRVHQCSCVVTSDAYTTRTASMERTCGS